MGVIKKVLYRGNILGKPRHQNLFLDMEENIHIHYRDLRIEMSRAEFEDFAATFRKQSTELQAIIEQKDYQDGKLPNANQDDVRIWTESRLKHEVKYHPRRFSLEECGDGYHFHYRNYKLLIDADEFEQIARLFRNMEIDGRYAATYDEVLALLEANEVDFVLESGNLPGEVLAIAVAHYHIPKIKEIFRYISFAASTEGRALHFSHDALTVIVCASKQKSAQEYRRLRSMSSTCRLADHLSRNGAAINADELNRIKCQVLDLYYVLEKGGSATVDTEPQVWLYAPETGTVIFPYSAVARKGRQDADAMYQRWSTLLAQSRLGFVKPTKKAYPAPAQEALRSRVEDALRREVAAFGVVSRIHVMGSAIRGELGRYTAPFVHGKLAKLGSDIDILVEIDAAYEADIPKSWRLINREASNHCAVYHIAEIAMDGELGDWVQTCPNVRFIQHLIDAYVDFPSQGHRDEKTAFLRRFGARLFYDRTRDGHVFADEHLQQIAASMKEAYALNTLPAVERMTASTENALYKVFSGGHVQVLKLFKVAGNYSRHRVTEHTAYEAQLATQLKQRGIATAGITAGEQATCPTIDGCPALLFERIPGEVQQKPEYRLAEIGAALAAIHRTQLDHPLDLSEAFTFDDACMIWLPTFDRYLHQTWDDPEIAAALADLAPLADQHHPGQHRGMLFGRSPSLHCHGDVTPKNVMMVDDTAWFFDFNNAFHGPRMADVIDGAFEFSLAEKYIQLADFSRFDDFVSAYAAHAALSNEEREDVPRWTELLGLIKFTKELRVIQQRPKNEMLRRQRALALANYMLGCQTTHEKQFTTTASH